MKAIVIVLMTLSSILLNGCGGGGGLGTVASIGIAAAQYDKNRKLYNKLYDNIGRSKTRTNANVNRFGPEFASRPSGSGNTFNFPCDGATPGTATFTLTDIDGDGLLGAVGEMLAINFSNCLDASSGTTLDGSLVTKIDPGTSTRKAITLTATNLRSSTVSGVHLEDGSISVVAEETSSQVEVRFSSAQYTTVDDGVTNTSKNTDYTFVVDKVTGNESLFGTETVSSSDSAQKLPITITIPAASPLIAGPADTFPTSGKQILTSGRSVLTYTITSGESVDVTLDENGDGSLEVHTVVHISEVFG